MQCFSLNPTLIVSSSNSQTQETLTAQPPRLHLRLASNLCSPSQSIAAILCAGLKMNESESNLWKIGTIILLG